MNTSRANNPPEQMEAADYSLPAELFVTRKAGSKRGGLHYHRFATATEAISFAAEEYKSLRPDDLVMAIDNKRFNLASVKLFYGSPEHEKARDGEPA
ncbi:hypothetical protein [Acuticoccus yangtzensis]|uniref:hypothetical protein n=1 Tax=Acuticoccus yangtzensis TaxID=1443441 RepID=UPI000949A173|nr:hypothetical protein [Acuticoccus yangtzensis]ORE95604.1 hypothetical protein ATO13_02060 [Stappia sp. 22II-S9-Z10]